MGINYPAAACSQQVLSHGRQITSPALRSVHVWIPVTCEYEALYSQKETKLRTLNLGNSEYSQWVQRNPKDPKTQKREANESKVWKLEAVEKEER